MTYPKPTPQKFDRNRLRKQRQKERMAPVLNKAKEDADSRKKLKTYICTIPDKVKKNVTYIREVRAPHLMDVGAICKERYGQFPIEVTLKPYTAPEHLTQRLTNHQGLQDLAKSLQKANSGKGKK